MSELGKIEKVVLHYVVALVPSEAVISVGVGKFEAKHAAYAAVFSVAGPILAAIWQKYKDTKEAIGFIKLYKAVQDEQKKANPAP